MAQNAKIGTDKRRGTYYVSLWWKGERYWRGHYDAKLKIMRHPDLAKRIQEAINADIDKKGPGFDPRQWFRTPGYEYQFSRYASNWIVKNRDRYAPSARRQTERYVQMAIDFFGESDLREIRNLDIQRFLDEGIPSNWSPKTKRDGALAVLHKIFSDAYKQELISRIPGWPKVQIIEPEVKWITQEWQSKIIEAIPEKDRPIFIFMATFGVRPGEARALQWEDVNFEKEIITIRRTFSGAGCIHLQPFTKTRRIRRLPMPGDLLRVLKAIRGIGGYVFRNSRGRPYTSDLSRIWNEARDAVGGPEVTLYQGVRHSFATQHLDNLDLVRQILGHSNANMTMRYQGINTDKIRELVAPADRKQEGRK